MNYFCGLMGTCSDIKQLKKDQENGIISKDLTDQYENLCSNRQIHQGQCGLDKEYRGVKN